MALPFLVILAIALGVKRRWSPLLTMGISTVVIGLLPGYATIVFFAPLLLALARSGQGLGLGGEWGGAALLATENAPPRKRALYGSFPQLGAPIGGFSSPTALSCCFPGY
ncbi:MFS transporter [Escherichia coli]